MIKEGLLKVLCCLRLKKDEVEGYVRKLVVKAEIMCFYRRRRGSTSVSATRG